VFVAFITFLYAPYRCSFGWCDTTTIDAICLNMQSFDQDTEDLVYLYKGLCREYEEIEGIWWHHTLISPMPTMTSENY